MTRNSSETWREVGQRLSNWGRWGENDERGTSNLVGPDQLVRGASMIKKGAVFDLGIPMDSEGPQDGRDRVNPQHFMSRLGNKDWLGGSVRFNDDYLMTALQAGTQWDGLAHVYYDETMYNGFPSTSVSAEGASLLGIENQARGVVGRAVLLDVARFCEVDWLEAGFAIAGDLLAAVADAQNVPIGAGDIVLVRTGWWKKFLDGRDRSTWILGDEPGLCMDACDWIAQSEVSAIAADNWAFEVLPSGIEGEAFPLHMILIRDMGLTLGEMFDLEELARDCAADGVYEMFLAAPVLKVTGAVATPTNPLAIK